MLCRFRRFRRDHYRDQFQRHRLGRHLHAARRDHGGEQQRRRQWLCGRRGESDGGRLQFAISPTDGSLKTIAPATRLPTITGPTSINGYTQAGAAANTLASGSNAAIKVKLDGFNVSNASNDAYGLAIGPAGSGSTVRGLVIGRFAAGGILLDASSNNTIAGNFIGVTETGNATFGNGGGSYGGGVNAFADAAGEAASGNIVGGTAAADRNVISTNGGGGVKIQAYSGGAANGNQVLGSVLGPNRLGTGAVTGTLVGLGPGITIGGAKNTTIGSVTGTTPGAACSGGCNLIGSGYYGIQMYSGDDGIGTNTIKGNYFGVTANGQLQMPVPPGNTLRGAIYLSGLNTGVVTIGGTTAAERNVISGSGNDAGVEIQNYQHTASIVIQGNYIGTDSAGTAAIPNGYGVHVYNSGGVTVGGTAAGTGNLISGNAYYGINLEGSVGTVIQGNKIGTDVNGTADLGNGRDGIRLGFGAIASDDNIIGANTSGGPGGNIIAFNGVDAQGNNYPSAGVALTSGVHNRISTNKIFSNVGSTGLGIDFYLDGPTPNDTCDVDAGPNDFTNAPSNITFTTNGGVTNVKGVMRGKASTTYTIEFYDNDAGDPSGYGEGKTYIGTTTVTTGAAPACQVAINANTATPLPAGHFITALAIDAQNNTSEFSGPYDLIFANGFDG